MKFRKPLFLFFSLTFAFFILSFCARYVQSNVLTSPDKGLTVEIETSPELSFLVKKEEETLIDKITVSLFLEDGDILAKNDKVERTKKHAVVHQEIERKVAVKNKVISDVYNQLILSYGGGAAQISPVCKNF